MGLRQALSGRRARRHRPRRRKPGRLRRYLPILRPARGHRLPRELTAPRIGRLAAALADGVRGEGIESLLRRVEAKPVHPGNQLVLYTSGEAAFAAMRQAIAAAQHEVLLESYIFKDDAVGRAILADLEGAVARGVEVRVLADALGSHSTRGEFWSEMEARGIAAHLFHPLFKQLWYQPFRDHRKLLVVDRQIGFTGGMNIGVEYGSRSAPGGPWRDSHVRVAGPAAWALAVVFSEGWEHAGGEPLDLPPLLLRNAPDGGDGGGTTAGNAGAAGGALGAGARVLVLDAQPLRGNREAAATLAAIAGAARQRLWITNAYFAPGHTAVRILGEAAARGVDVRLLLPGRTDVPVARHAGHGYFAGLLASGVRIFEYQAAILHAKSMVVDGHLAVVGSTNLDFRSFLFNAECNLVVFDDEFAARVQSTFERDLESAVPIEAAAWRQRPRLHRAGDRLARWLSPLL